MDLQQLGEGVAAFKNAIDIFKSAASLLPTRQKEEALEKAAQAEKAFKLAEATLAKSLGYVLCQCQFPPAIALYVKEKGAHICPECGETYSMTPMAVARRREWDDY